MVGLNLAAPTYRCADLLSSLQIDLTSACPMRENCPQEMREIATKSRTIRSNNLETSTVGKKVVGVGFSLVLSPFGRVCGHLPVDVVFIPGAASNSRILPLTSLNLDIPLQALTLRPAATRDCKAFPS